LTTPMERFAAEVGAEGPVCVVGGMTQWGVGGPPDEQARRVSAPAGVATHVPAEMIVRVRAGTRLQDLADVLAEGGQRVALEGSPDATVGGVVSVGRSGVRRLGLGPVRDSVLEVTAVNSRGELIRSGAPLVKNVTGFDLCRLLTGSLGTLAMLGEVVLRCSPLPEAERWFVGDAEDPVALCRSLYRPTSVLWDGQQTWVGLAGFVLDIEDQAKRVLGGGFAAAEGPPALPGVGRRSLVPAALRGLADLVGETGRWLAEVGVGIVHCDDGAAAAIGPPALPSPGLEQLHRRIKQNFDPLGRLNPGRAVLTYASVGV
jgi:FAD/FMN-containing dehydrogenase